MTIQHEIVLTFVNETCFMTTFTFFVLSNSLLYTFSIKTGSLTYVIWIYRDRYTYIIWSFYSLVEPFPLFLGFPWSGSFYVLTIHSCTCPRVVKGSHSTTFNFGVDCSLDMCIILTIIFVLFPKSYVLRLFFNPLT